MVRTIFKFLRMKTWEDLKRLNPKYYWQCVMNTMITGSDYCDFISYDPRKPDHLKMAVIRIERDETEMLVLRERLVEAENFKNTIYRPLYATFNCFCLSL